MEFSQEHISAFNAYRAKGFRFDGLSASQLEALREDPHIARAIVQEQQAAVKVAAAAAAATPAPRAAAAVPTLPAPDVLVAEKREDIDAWVERNQNCAAPIAYVSALGDALWEYAKANTKNNEGRNARLDALEQRVALLEAKPSIKYCGVHEALKQYAPGDGVTAGGNLWICRMATTGAPGEDFTGWQLAVRKGRDGKDRR